MICQLYHRKKTKTISKIKELCKVEKIDTVLINMYYYDILHFDYLSLYEDAGFKIVTAGHQLDLNFVSRLKSLIEICDFTAANSVGTHLGYCVYMGKPHLIIDDEIINKTNFEDYKEIGYSFTDYYSKLQDKQLDVVSKYWGFNDVKDRTELRNLLLM